MFRRVKTINFLSKRTGFKKLKAGSYFLSIGRHFKGFKAYYKKKKVKTYVTTQKFFLQKKDSCCVKSKKIRGAVVQKKNP